MVGDGGVIRRYRVTRLALAVRTYAKCECYAVNAKENIRPFVTFAKEFSEEFFAKMFSFSKENLKMRKKIVFATA